MTATKSKTNWYTEENGILHGFNFKIVFISTRNLFVASIRNGPYKNLTSKAKFCSAQAVSELKNILDIAIAEYENLLLEEDSKNLLLNCAATRELRDPST